MDNYLNWLWDKPHHEDNGLFALGSGLFFFLAGLLDGKKERDQKELDAAKEALNNRSGYIEAARDNYEYLNEHLINQLAITRGELTYIQEKMAKRIEDLEEELAYYKEMEKENGR